MFNQKKTPLIILGITSLIFSRVMFSLFNDPEGPNLLVVTVMAAIIYALSFATYLFKPLVKKDSVTKLLLMIFVQIVITFVFYICLS